MKSWTLPLIAIISLILITLAFSLPCQGESFLANLLELLAEAKRNVAAYDNKIKLSVATVQAIGDDMDGVRPPGEDRSPDERVKFLKEGITGELAKAKANQLALKIATEQLGVALDRNTKTPTPANLKNAQDIAKQINSYRDLLNGNFEIIRGMLSQISKIRRNFDEKEWDKLDGKYKDEREAIDNLWNSLKVVPNVVDMSLRRAIEALAEVGLTPGSLVTAPAPSEDLSEKVTRQEPKAGEFFPPGKTVKLWHYTRFGGMAPPVTPPSTGAQGFKPGDASLIDPLFASQENIHGTGRGIYSSHPAGLPWLRSWTIAEFPSPEAARAAINKYANQVTKQKTGSWKTSNQEVNHRFHIAEDGVADYWTHTSFGYKENSAETSIGIYKIYRDKFVIHYYESTQIYNDNLKKNWAPIYEKFIKLIDLRFPPEPKSGNITKGEVSTALSTTDRAVSWIDFYTRKRKLESDPEYNRRKAQIESEYQERIKQLRDEYGRETNKIADNLEKFRGYRDLKVISEEEYVRLKESYRVLKTQIFVNNEAKAAKLREDKDAKFENLFNSYILK